MSKRSSREERAYSIRRWVQRAWWKAQRFWWRLLETWPFSAVVMFVRSLPLLTLWLFVAFVVFHLLPPSLKTPDKEALSLLGVLVTALIGFGVQQWKVLTEEERSKQQKCQEALDEIDKLGPLIRSDPSEGARRYVDMMMRRGVWTTSRVRSCLEEVWSTAPRVLQDAAELLNSLEGIMQTAMRLGAERSVKALEWARENLDDEWQQKALDGLRSLSTHPGCRNYISSPAQQEIEQRPWRAILRPWPHISLWRGFSPPADSEIAKSLAYLGLKGSPFGSTEAETDTLLLTCAVDPSWLKHLYAPPPVILTGASGSGKTATAFLLVRDSLQEQDAFPVYFPVPPGDLKLGMVAQVTARTLLHYLAVAPASFLRCGVAGKAAMARLLACYASPNLALSLHQAGLPLTGEGARMLQEIEALIPNASLHEPLPDGELAVLGKARPHVFQYTMLLLDVQEQAGRGKDTALEPRLQSLLDLSDRLAQVGVFVKAFLPDTFRQLLQEQKGQSRLSWMELQWSDDDLSGLLKARLAQFGEDTLAAWCDPEARDMSPDERLIRAAQGLPGNLIRKGGELLWRIGQTQHTLTAQDLDELLGPWPAQFNGQTG